MGKALAALAAMGIAFNASSAEVKVLSGGAVKSAFTAATQEWEKKSGHKVVAAFAPAGELRKRVGAGEVADILVVPSENLPEYEKGGTRSLMMKGGRNPEQARALLDYLTSSEGRQAFLSRGFTAPGAR